jgi:hypothetical protein
MKGVVLNDNDRASALEALQRRRRAAGAMPDSASKTALIRVLDEMIAELEGEGAGSAVG